MRKKLLTTGKIAEYCQVTDRAVLKWISEGKLEAYQTPGKHSRVRMDDFISFLKKYNMPIPEDIEDPTRKKKILIIDDDKKIVELMKKALFQDDRYTVKVAYSGFRGGEIFFRFQPDLIVLDIMMPGLDGYDVCQYIRENLENQRVRILAISGIVTPEESSRIMDLGANEFLPKPFEIKVFQEKVRQILGKVNK